MIFTHQEYETDNSPEVFLQHYSLTQSVAI